MVSKTGRVISRATIGSEGGLSKGSSSTPACCKGAWVLGGSLAVAVPVSLEVQVSLEFRVGLKVRVCLEAWVGGVYSAW